MTELFVVAPRRKPKRDAGKAARVPADVLDSLVEERHEVLKAQAHEFARSASADVHLPPDDDPLRADEEPIAARDLTTIPDDDTLKRGTGRQRGSKKPKGPV